ncbi:EamA family transporter [Patescibacteria group bacterium]
MKGIIYALGAGFFLGWTYFLDKVVMSRYDIPPLWGAFGRFWVATLAISLIVSYKFHFSDITIDMKNSMAVLSCAGLTFAIAVFCIFSSLEFLSAGKSTILNNTTGVITALFLSLIFLGEEISLAKIFGIGLCLSGIILVAK